MCIAKLSLKLSILKHTQVVANFFLTSARCWRGTQNTCVEMIRIYSNIEDADSADERKV